MLVTDFMIVKKFSIFPSSQRNLKFLTVQVTDNREIIRILVEQMHELKAFFNKIPCTKHYWSELSKSAKLT